MVACNVVGSYTSKITFQRGVGNTGPSNAIVTSPPKGAVTSLSTLTPAFDSNCARSSEKCGSLLPMIWKKSSTIALGFLITNEFTMVALGETNSRLPIEAGAANQDAM